MGILTFILPQQVFRSFVPQSSSDPELPLLAQVSAKTLNQPEDAPTAVAASETLAIYT